MFLLFRHHHSIVPYTEKVTKTYFTREHRKFSFEAIFALRKR